MSLRWKWSAGRVAFAVGCVVALAGVAGCLDRELKPLIPCVVSGVVRDVQVTNVDKVDVLFMIDNSNSMTEEQTSLGMQLPRLFTVLASGDVDGDGMMEFPPVRSLHAGVVTSDMGTGGFVVPTCAEPNFGDDGVLRTRGNTAIGGCNPTYPSFVDFTVGGNVAAASNDFACVAVTGTGGCGFEQQLESVLKALTPSTSAIRFNMGTLGHGDTENGGFLRPDSLLAMILVTDEEDCSVADPELFNPDSGVYPGDLNLRCFQYPSAVQPVSRFVDGYMALRSNPNLLIYAAITGIPARLSMGDPDSIDYDAILNDPEMQETIDPAMPTRLTPSCNVPGRGVAFPPRRIVTVAKELHARGAGGIVQSICQADFSPALNAIIAKIADVLNNVCLPRPLPVGATGLVSCDVVEYLPLEGDFTTCDSLADRGRVYVRTDPSGQQVCRVTQLTQSDGMSGAGAGWYYDTTSATVMMNCPDTPQRIAFTGGAEPVTNVRVRLECLQPVQGAPGVEGGDIIGLACDTGCGGPLGTMCDTLSGTCQLPCTSDAECPAALVCHPERLFCVNPTCGN